MRQKECEQISLFRMEYGQLHFMDFGSFLRSIVKINPLSVLTLNLFGSAVSDAMCL